MLIIGVNPGEKESAWVLYANTGGVHSVTQCGQGANADVADQLAHLGDGCGVTALALEMPANYGERAVGRSLYDTAYWAGIFAHAFDPQKGQPNVVRVTRPEVIRHWCLHRSGYNEAQVKIAVADRLWRVTPMQTLGSRKQPGPLHCFRLAGGDNGHRWAALAAAAWCAETIELPKRKE